MDGAHHGGGTSDGDGAPHGNGDPGSFGAAAEDRALLARTRAAPVLAGPLPAFAPEDAPAAPGPLFAAWLDLALADGVPEPQVMTLSTADADGAPSARVLILRGVDTADCAVAFASDAASPKGRDLTANPRAALTWYWPAHGRQIRMTGPVDVLGPDAARTDFLGRSPSSRAAGFTGRVSRPLSGPAEYDRAHRAARDLVETEPGRVPDGHTVYRVRAQEAEFFQADPRRFHLRLHYTRGHGGWTRTLLWP